MYVAQIIDIINGKIEEALSCKADGGVVYGIAEQTVRKADSNTQVFPTYYDNDGNGKDVTVDDNYPFVVYHRLLNKSYQYPLIKSFGNPKDYIQETSEIVTLVYAKRQYLKINAEQVESVIKLSIPATLNTLQLTDLQLKSCIITHTSSTLDTQTNFNSEYRGFDSFLSSNEIFISLRFTIETVFKKDCLNKFCEVTPKTPSVYLFADTYCVDGSGIIEIGWIAYNVDYVTISGLGKRKPIGFEQVSINGNTTITITAGTATDSISIADSCDGVCLDATAVLKNTAGTTLSTTDIPSGDTQDIIAPNGHVHIKKENDGTIANVFPPSGATVNYIVQDSDVEVNGVLQGSVHAEETVDIQLEDSGGNPVTPTSVSQSGNTFTIEVPSGGLTADFSVDDTTPETNQTITFTDLSVGATTWLWTIQLDGGTYENTSTLQNPTFELPYVGTYTVTLSITDGSGGEGVETKASYINASLQPLPVTNLQAHYNAMQGASPSNLTLVSGVASQWNDDVSGYHLAQGSPTARPLYTFPAITSANGTQYGELTGDGINDFLQNTNVLFTRGTNTTVYLVIKFISNIGSGVFLMQNGTTAATAGVQILANNNQYRLSNGVNADSWMMFPQGGYAAVKFQFGNVGTGTPEVQINEFIKLIGNTGLNTGAGLTLFSNYLGGVPINVSIAKAIVYSDNVSGADNDKVFQHIKAQLGIGQCL